MENPPTELLIATGNPGKAREFREMLGSERIVWRDLSEFSGDQAVPETGSTFDENARLKASGYALRHHSWTLADDSGLEVDALNGQPGVYSARWAAMHDAGSGDAANNALLLQQLRDLPAGRRGARFVCVLALADPAGRIAVTTRATVEGRVLSAAVGENGFGYDPLFFVESLGRTTAELPAEQKHAISHRGKAARALAAWLDRLDLSQPKPL